MPQNAVSDQGLYFLLTQCSILSLIMNENNIQQPLKQKWTVPFNKSGNFYFGLNWLIRVYASCYTESHYIFKMT